MLVKVSVNNVYTKLQNFYDLQLGTLFDKQMSFVVPGYFFSPLYKEGKWDGRRRLYSMKYNLFPTGLLSIAKELFMNYDINYTLIDERKKPILGDQILLNNVSLYDYQQEIVRRSLFCQRGIVKAPTGAGKTEMMIGIIARLNVKTLLLIHRIDIFNQLLDRIKDRLQVEVGEIRGDNNIFDKKISVGMVQTIYNLLKSGNQDIKKFLNSVQCVLFDECHHIPADSIYALSKYLKNAYYRFGFSATPWREDNADIMIQAVTGRCFYDLKASTLIRKGYLVKPYIYFISNPPLGENTQILDYKNLYTYEIVQNYQRNLKILKLVEMFLSYNKNILIAVSRIEHGEILVRMLRENLKHYADKIVFVSGDVDDSIRKKVLRDLNEKKILVVIATTVFGEGIDVPSLEVLINAKSQNSSVDAFQLLGRGLRKCKGKDKAIVVDFKDMSKYLVQHYRRRKKIYNTEEEFVIKEIQDVSQLKLEGSDE